MSANNRNEFFGAAASGDYDRRGSDVDQTATHPNEYPGKTFVPGEGSMLVDTVEMTEPDHRLTREGISTITNTSLRVEERLAGIRAVKNGIFVSFIMEGSDGESLLVTPENAEEAEATIINDHKKSDERKK